MYANGIDSRRVIAYVWSCRGVTLPSVYRHRGLDFVCSMPHDDGMSKCVDLLPFVLNGTRCMASATIDDWTTTTDPDVNQSCIDWHLYYTSCRATDHNPFQNSISFDDIGHAWVAIFQVPHLDTVIAIRTIKVQYKMKNI